MTEAEKKTVAEKFFQAVERDAILRDMFAAVAMAAILVSEQIEAFRKNNYQGGNGGPLYVPQEFGHELAECAYRQADAMMEVRARKGNI